MHGYAPGEQPAVGERVVKLNTNENPFPPSPRVMAAIRGIEPELLRRYPDPTADGFRRACARVLGVSIDEILAGNGSDDILTIVTRTFIPPGGRLAVPHPTYSLYPILAALEDATCLPIPWEKNWSLPTAGLLGAHADAIYIANPNAPSGTFVSPAELGKLAGQFAGVVLIDEAYVDFANDNCLGLLKEHANIVISRTLSKAYSLAGLRFGYAVARAQLIEQMMKVKDSYNCDAISVLAATAAIQDQEHARQTWANVRQERQRVAHKLTQMGFDVLPSQANFLLAGAPDGDGRSLFRRLKGMGILVRHFDQPGLSDKIRVTIGSMQENNALLGGIQTLLAAPAPAPAASAPAPAPSAAAPAAAPLTPQKV